MKPFSPTDGMELGFAREIVRASPEVLAGLYKAIDGGAMTIYGVSVPDHFATVLMAGVFLLCRELNIDGPAAMAKFEADMAEAVADGQAVPNSTEDKQ